MRCYTTSGIIISSGGGGIPGTHEKENEMGNSAFEQIMEAENSTDFMMALCLIPQEFTEDEEDQIERKAKELGVAVEAAE